MNLLAHALLAHLSLPECEGQSTTGALMADYISGQAASAWPADLARAIRQHIAIDDYTDRHPLFRDCRRLIAAEGAPRFTSGILTDIFWGHLLGARWRELGQPLCNLDLHDFCEVVYCDIRKTSAWHSPSFRRATEWIIKYNWLELYAGRDGVVFTLEGLATRMSGAAGLAGCIRILDEHPAAIGASFSAFWPQVVEFARGWND